MAAASAGTDTADRHAHRPHYHIVLTAAATLAATLATTTTAATLLVVLDVDATCLHLVASRRNCQRVVFCEVFHTVCARTWAPRIRVFAPSACSTTSDAVDPDDDRARVTPGIKLSFMSGVRIPTRILASL